MNRDKFGLFKPKTIECEYNYPCDLTYQIKDCKNKHLCIKTIESELREELSKTCKCSTCGFKHIKGGCARLGVPGLGCAIRKIN